VLCVGDPILDIVAHASPALLETLGFGHGGCDLIDENDLENIMSKYVSEFGPLSRYV
jgi:hypothetical protein